MKSLSIFFSISLFLLVTAFTQLNAQTTKAYVGTGYGTGVDIFDVDSLTLIGSIAKIGGSSRTPISIQGNTSST